MSTLIHQLCGKCFLPIDSRLFVVYFCHDEVLEFHGGFERHLVGLIASLMESSGRDGTNV